MMDKLHDKLEQIQVPLGYGMAGGLTTVPLWVHNLTDWLQLLAVSVGIAVGLTTLYINFRTIKKRK